MQSQLKSLSKIFAESIFRIPDYQRGYSWEDRHLKDFWNDIEQLSLGKNHYTGVLTLEPVDSVDYQKWEDDIWIIESKQYQPLYIVDGQQRLTTAIILLQSIIDRLSDGETLNYFTKEEIRKKYIFESKDGGISRSYIFGYEKDNPSSEFLKQEIFGEQSDIHSILEDTVYTRNLDYAKTFFRNKVSGLDKTGLESVFAKLTQNLQFNIFFIEPELDVFVTFETMNNRGKPLSHLELLKNRLIYLSTRFSEEKREREHLRKAINESWKAVYHFLGKVASSKFNDDMFLRTHFISYFGPELFMKSLEIDSESDSQSAWFHRHLRGEFYKDYLLESVFTPKRLQGGDNQLNLEEVYNYAKHIKETVQTYYQVASPEESKWRDEEKVLLACIRRLEKNDVFVFTIAVMSNVEDADLRLALLTSLERYAFLYRLSPYFFRGFNVESIAVKMLADQISVEEIIREFSTVCGKFVGSPEFIEVIKSIGKGGGYYSWGALRYFMYEYEQDLRRKSKSGRQLLNWKEYTREIYEGDYKTVEHIYPQKATDPYWKSKFSQYTVQERNLLRNSLGNLLPVSHSKNSSLSNKSFDVKKGSKIVQVGYCYGCLSEIQVSHENEWGALQILNRGVALLDFMGRRWGIPFGDVESRAKLLGLSFVTSREGIDVATLDNTLPIPTASEIAEAHDPEAPLEANQEDSVEEEI